MSCWWLVSWRQMETVCHDSATRVSHILLNCCLWVNCCLKANCCFWGWVGLWSSHHPVIIAPAYCVVAQVMFECVQFAMYFSSCGVLPDTEAHWHQLQYGPNMALHLQRFAAKPCKGQRGTWLLIALQLRICSSLRRERITWNLQHHQMGGNRALPEPLLGL